MGKRSTVTGYWRARGNSSNSTSTGPTPAVLPMVLAVTVDPAAAQGTPIAGKFLPAGAIILGVTIVSSHVGGTAPLTDIGIVGTVDGIVNGGVATANLEIDVATATAGANVGVALGADVQVVGGTGGGTPGAGTAVAYIRYTVTDDGALAS